jgi:D-alanyl-D-alanine carboxypeptidase/D-alanyl-D-alanine-endopeptidase (penicillin-binding protein 4)
MTSSLRPLRELVASVAARPEFDGARWGVCAQWRGDSELLIERDIDSFFVPASNTKLYTIAAAQEVLGCEAQLCTEFWLEPAVSGRANRRLAFVGGGDPTLSYTHLEEAARAAVAAVAGDTVVIDIEVDLGRIGRAATAGSWSWSYLEDTAAESSPPSGLPSAVSVRVLIRTSTNSY